MNRYINLFYLLFITTLMFATGRIMMYLLNNEIFQSENFYDISLVLLSGLTYDVRLVLFINSPLILLFFWPSLHYNKPVYQSVLKLYYIIINSIALLINLLDIQFIKTYSKRMDFGSIKNEIHGIFEHLGEIEFQAILSDLWVILFTWLIMLAILSYALWFLQKRTNETRYVAVFNSGIGTLMVVAIIYFTLNSYYSPQIWMKSIYEKFDRKLVPLLVNNPYLIFRTSSFYYYNNNTDWYLDEYKAVKQYDAMEYNNNSLVRIIIIEHESRNSFLPYVNCKDTSLNNHKLRLISKVHSKPYKCLDEILTGFPSFMTTDFYQSPYSLNRIYTLPELLKKSDYNTLVTGYALPAKELRLIKHFYHFDKLNFFVKPTISYSTIQKYKKDNKYFELVLFHLQENEFDTFGEYISWLVKNTEINGTNDKQINIIIELGKSESKNLLPETMHVYYSNKQMDFRPGKYQVSQFLDILPTVLHYINYKDAFLAYGSSIFTRESKIWMEFKDNENYIIMKDSLVMECVSNKAKSLKALRNFRISGDDLRDSLIFDKTQMESLLKAILNDLHQRAYHNHLYE